jgi:molecular chaperone HtpG
MARTQDSAPQRMEFQTEAKQLLHLVINSLYTHKEVFLRELVSNASDALDKLRFESLTKPELGVDPGELAIRIHIDKKAKTIRISDNGIGMTRQEVIDNIGTIARSGSKAFLDKLTGNQKADSNLIGQFGVGFYSVFMVASSVKIITRRAGSDEQAVLWESKGISDYEICDAEKKTHGTDITVFLKPEESVYSEAWKVRELIKKYSDYIAFPIYLPDDKGKDEVVNESKPLWKRSASEITQEQYELFFKHALGGFDAPLAVVHTKAEGVLEYDSLLFIPPSGQFEMFNLERTHGVKLYVKRVFIMDNCKELIPEFLRFVKGVVDCEDLPLNVSRETLQHNPIMEKIRKALVAKLLGKLAELADTSPETYKSFWKQFGPILKEGTHTDADNREKIIGLLRFQSSMGQSEDDLVSLRQYVDRMRDGQKEIYYMAGERRDIVEKSPHLELLRSKGVEVLYLLDPIDEFILPDIQSFDGKQLKSVVKGDLDLGDIAREETKQQKDEGSKVRKLAERMKNILADDVKEVRPSARLTDSPCCLVSDEFEMSAHMEKVMRAMGQNVPPAKRTLEINPSHPVIRNCNALYEKNPSDVKLEQWVRLLFDQALIAEGQMVKDPRAFSKRIADLLTEVSTQGGAEG